MNDHINKDWQLRVRIEWILKNGRDLEVYCISCKGRGSWFEEKRGWGLGCDEDEQVHCWCKKCQGRGHWKSLDIAPRPEIPEELINRLRDCFNQYSNEQEGNDPQLAKLNAELARFEEENNFIG